MSNQYKPNT